MARQPSQCHPQRVLFPDRKLPLARVWRPLGPVIISTVGEKVVLGRFPHFRQKEEDDFICSVV